MMQRNRAKHKKNLFLIFAFLIPALLSLTMTGCSNSSGSRIFSGNSAQQKDTEPVSKSGNYFDTVITITLYGQDKESEIKECFRLAKHYENLLSNTIQNSDVSRINAHAGEYVKVHKDTIAVIRKALEYCKLSSGSFDITIGRLSDLWHFTDNKGTIPSASEIRKNVKNVDYTNVRIKGDKIALLNKKAKLDLGGIAKGFIADEMKARLLNDGVKNGIINLGGNVLVLGSKPDGSEYNVGIQKPFGKTGEAIAAVSVSGKSVVSSGAYERYFKKNGRIYHHILDTATGYPADNDLYSVTIISDRSVDGDGLSTTCFTLGLEKGMDLIENTDDTEAVFITSDNKLHYTTGITLTGRGNTIKLTKL